MTLRVGGDGFVDGERCARCGCTNRINATGCTHSDKHCHLTCLSCGFMFTSYAKSYDEIRLTQQPGAGEDNGEKDESKWWQKIS